MSIQPVIPGRARRVHLISRDDRRRDHHSRGRRVVEILRQVSAQLMEDEALRPLILDPFDYQGVDTLDASSVVLLLRIRTVASKQWVVGRAFNRLVKIAFDKHGPVARARWRRCFAFSLALRLLAWIVLLALAVLSICGSDLRWVAAFSSGRPHRLVLAAKVIPSPPEVLPFPSLCPAGLLISKNDHATAHSDGRSP